MGDERESVVKLLYVDEREGENGAVIELEMSNGALLEVDMNGIHYGQDMVTWDRLFEVLVERGIPKA